MIDTSGPACGVALMRGDGIVCDMQLISGRTHSQRVMPMVEAALSMSEMTTADIDLFGAVVGPGSFTGVRIGVSSVKALAHAAGKPCVGVDALWALAANVQAFDGVICPILDARAQQVYGAMFRAGDVPERLTPDEAIPLTQFLDRALATGERAMFLGDGVAAFRETIAKRLGERAAFAAPQHMNLRASSACALAKRLHEQGQSVDYIHLLPLYLRAPQAERERAAREAKSRA